MTDLPPPATSLMNDSATLPKLIYILYLAGFVVGITPLIGLVLAYIYQDEAPAWLQTHYRFLIRTFWIGLLYGMISSALCLVLVGFALLFIVSLWIIIRCIHGLKYISRGEAYPNPATWGFG